jgi:predicted alternative tryptophan synthase beta-subunit
MHNTSIVNVTTHNCEFEMNMQNGPVHLGIAILEPIEPVSQKYSLQVYILGSLHKQSYA